MRRDRNRYVILTPKTDKGIERMSFHGNKWILKEVKEKLRFASGSIPHYCLLSRNGDKILFVRQKDDPDFDVRELQ